MTAGGLEVELGPTLYDFLVDDSFVRAIVGPFGSGKSTACCFEMLRRAKEQAPGPDGIRRTRWAAVRNTLPQLQDTTRRTFEDWLRRSGLEDATRWVESESLAVIRRDDVELEVLFRALDRPSDVAKLLSLELTGAWLNEAREIRRAIFDAIQGRVGRYPSRADCPLTWRGIILDTNPPDVDSWFYKVFEEERPEGHRLFHQPSGLSPAAENVDNLDPGYYSRLAAGKSEDFVRVYVRGEYGFVRDGKPIYPEWHDTLHAVEFPTLPTKDIILGMDFGLTPAAVLCQRDPMDGQLQVFDELTTENMGATSFARLLATKIKGEYPGRLVRGWGDPAGEQRSQVDERTPFDVVLAAELPVSPAPTNDYTLRRDAVGGLLSRLTMAGRPALVVHPRCRQLRKAMSGAYCYRRIHVVVGEKYSDKPDKNIYSHVAEALQYAAVGEGEDQRAVYGSREYRRVELPFGVRRSVAL